MEKDMARKPLSTRELAAQVGVSTVDIHNWKVRFPDRLYPMNPGGKFLKWDQSMVDVATEINRGLRKYGDRRPMNCVG